MVQGITDEGFVLGQFVIFDGICVVLFPPINDEAQGYAIIAIGIFIVLSTMHLTRISEGMADGSRLS